MPILETCNFSVPTKTNIEIYGTIQWLESLASFTFTRGETTFTLFWNYKTKEFMDEFDAKFMDSEIPDLPLHDFLGTFIDLEWLSDEIEAKHEEIVSMDNENEQFNRDCDEREFWRSR